MKKDDNIMGVEDKIGIALLDNHIHLLSGEINEETINETIRWIIYENLSETEKTLALYINSPGGDLNEAFGLIDIMRNSKHPIQTIGLGSVCSAAFLIFAAGTKGERYISKNTSIMCHQYTGDLQGKYHDMKAYIRENELTNLRMISLLQECTDLEPRAIKTKLLPPSDVWFTAEELVELGVADQIL